MKCYFCFLLLIFLPSLVLANGIGFSDSLGSFVVPYDNVGIGSANPGQKLDVIGTVRATGFVTQSGAVLTGSQWTTINTHDVYLPSNGNVGIGTTLTTGAALTVMNGNVGIGTASPQKPLDVRGDVNIASTPPGSGYDNTLLVGYAGAGYSAMTIRQSYNFGFGGGDIYYYLPDGNHYLHMTSGNPWQWYSTDAIYFDSAASIELNAHAGNGNAVNTYINTLDDGVGNMIVGATSDGSLTVNNNDSEAEFVVTGNGSTLLSVHSNDHWVKTLHNTLDDGSGNAQINGTLSSYRYVMGTGPDFTMVPVSGGQSAIQSYWAMQLVGNNQTNPATFTPSNIGNADDASVIIPNQQASKIGLIVQGAASQTGNLFEWRNSSRTGLGAIDKNGNIGIGSTTPSQKLDVNGTIHVSGNVGIGTTAPGAGLDVETGSNSYFGGNVGIGSASPAGALDVGTGTICLNHSCQSTWPSGAVSSVSNSNGSLTISPATGAVVASLNVGNANTWTATQTISAANLATDTSTGMKIGTATNQKLGFFNNTPVVQPSGDILTALGTTSGLGLIATPSIAQADVTGLTTASSPTFAGLISTANVGIGSATPGQTLDVTGTVRATQFIAGTGGITLGGVNNTSWPSGATTSGTNMLFGNGSGAFTNVTNTAVSGGNIGIGTTTLTSNLLTIGSTGQDVIATNGNVGIGTSNPIGALDTVSSISTSSGASSGYGGNNYRYYDGSRNTLLVDTIAGTNNSNEYPLVEYYGGAGIGTGASPVIYFGWNFNNRQTGHRDAYMSSALNSAQLGMPANSVWFDVLSDNAAATVFRATNFIADGGNIITRTGSIGIGSTSPVQKLDVEGAVYMSGNVGIGTSVPANLLAVGATSQFQVNSSGRITPRVDTTASGATVTPTGDISDLYTVTALAQAATIAAPSGTPTNGQRLMIRIKDNGTARALTWDSIYNVVGVTLPTTTVLSKTMYVGCMYDTANSKWDVLAVGQEQ